MGLLSGLTKLWKKKNKLRSKISPISREIDKMTGMDQIWGLPGAQLRPDEVPNHTFSNDISRSVRLGVANWGAGGVRAIAPAFDVNGDHYDSRILTDTIGLGAATPMAAASAATPTPIDTTGLSGQGLAVALAYNRALQNQGGGRAGSRIGRALTMAMDRARASVPAAPTTPSSTPLPIQSPLPGLRVPSTPGLSTIRMANPRRPFTMEVR